MSELTDLKLPAAIPRNNMDTKSLIGILVNSKIKIIVVIIIIIIIIIIIMIMIIIIKTIIIWQIYHYNHCSVLKSEISVLSLTSKN